MIQFDQNLIILNTKQLRFIWIWIRDLSFIYMFYICYVIEHDDSEQKRMIGEKSQLSLLVA